MCIPLWLQCPYLVMADSSRITHHLTTFQLSHTSCLNKTISSLYSDGLQSLPWDHLYPVMKHFHLDKSRFLQPENDSEWFDNMKMISNLTMAFAVTRAQLNGRARNFRPIWLIVISSTIIIIPNEGITLRWWFSYRISAKALKRTLEEVFLLSLLSFLHFY